jgi:hypothetical protein
MRLAAIQKDMFALDFLAMAYSIGIGVPLNFVASYALHRLADLYDLEKEKPMDFDISQIVEALTKKQIQLSDELFDNMSKSDNLLKVLDDYVSNHAEKFDSLTTDNSYMDFISCVLRGGSQNKQSPIELPENNLSVKSAHNRRKSKKKKR